MINIAIYGAGNFGKYVFDESKKTNKYEAKIFIDNGVRGNTWNKLGIPIVDVGLFKNDWANQIDMVFIAVSNLKIAQDMVLSLLPWYKRDIYIADEYVFGGQLPIFDSEGELKSYIRIYKNFKPELSYIEHDLTSFCNLKCKNCGHKSDLATKIDKSDRAEYEKSFEALGKLFSNIKQIRLMGGEPFVVDDLDWYISIARKNFPLAEIRIVTNGLLIPKVSDRILKSIRENNVIIQISQYPPTRERMDAISEKIRKYDVRLQVGRPIEYFMKRINREPIFNEMYRSIFANCASSHCHTLKDGKLMLCGAIISICEMLEKEKVYKDAYKDNTIDLIELNSFSGWDALMLLEQASKLCGYCPIERKWVRWESTIL